MRKAAAMTLKGTRSASNTDGGKEKRQAGRERDKERKRERGREGGRPAPSQQSNENDIKGQEEEKRGKKREVEGRMRERG